MAVNRRRVALLAAVWLGPSVIAMAIMCSSYSRYHIDTPPRLSDEARAAAIAPIRAALDGESIEPVTHAELTRPLAHRGPVVVSVWINGGMRARLTVHGDTAAQAIDAAARRITEHANIRELNPGPRERARIKVDVVVGRGELLRSDDALARATGAVFDGLKAEDAQAKKDKDKKKRKKKKGLTLEHVAMHPGIDGLGVTIDGDAETVLLPDELMRGRLLMAEQPLDFVPEFKLGLRFEVANQSLAGLSGMVRARYDSADRHYWRFISDAFIERPEGSRGAGPPIALTRNMPPRPELSEAALRRAAIAGGRYLVAHLAPNGRYIYEQNLSNGAGTDPNRPGPYSIPRHAGTTYFLAELYRITGEAFLREPIERAFAHLQKLLTKGGCQGNTPDGARFACVIDHLPKLDQRIIDIGARAQAASGAERERLLARLHTVQGYKSAGLGSTALAVVALAEFKRATDSDEYMPMARALTEWILLMQRDDGSFRHLYVVPRHEPVEDKTLLYFSGEAALALARMHLVTGEDRYRVAAEKALDWLVNWYDFFVGGFLYGEEHWTCIAAEAIYPAVKKDSYRVFCNGYAEFLRRQQFGPGDFPGQSDLVGAYGVSPFVMPYNTPAGSRTEAMISAYLLGAKHGKPEPAIRAQILAAMHYVLGQQITEDSAWDVNPRAKGLGAFPGTPTDRVVRIDYVQHVCSALIRSIDVLRGG